MGVYDIGNECFSDNQDFDGETTGTTVESTNKMKVGPGDFGQGNDMLLDVIVTEAFTNIVSLQVQLQTDDDVDFGSPTVLYETPAIVLADLVASYKFAMKAIPPNCEDYLRLAYVLVGGTDPDAGQIFAALAVGTQDSNLSI